MRGSGACEGSFTAAKEVQGVECCCSREERTGISLSCQISSGAASPLMMVLHCHSGTLELIISLGRHLDQHHYLWRQKHQRCPLVCLSLLYTMWFAFDASKIFFLRFGGFFVAAGLFHKDPTSEIIARHLWSFADVSEFH